VSTYAAQANTAHALLSRKGATVTFTRKTASAFNPVTQTETAVSTTFSMKGIALPPGKDSEFALGSLERRNILEFHLAPRLGTTPQPGDKIRWAGYDWSVIWVSDLNPAGDGAPYTKCYAER